MLKSEVAYVVHYDQAFNAHDNEPLRVGRESSLKTKELFNLPTLVLKARHFGGSAFCNFYRLGVPEQALGGISLGFGIVVEDKLFELSCITLKLHILSLHIKSKFACQLMLTTYYLQLRGSVWESLHPDNEEFLL